MFFLALGAGCAATTPVSVTPERPDKPVPVNPDDPVAVADKAARDAKFNATLAEMVRLDSKHGWNADTCKRVADVFLAIATAKDEDTFVEAIYNAGIAYERCELVDEARAQYERSVEAKATFHPAKVRLIMMRFQAGGEKDLDRTIAELRQTAIVDAQYKNVEALALLAMLSMRRGNEAADSDGPNDRARAVRYLQSALAVDDNYIPAMNGLALYYLDAARTKAAAAQGNKAVGARRQNNNQAMELAALVCSQAIRKDPSDAVVYNTLGMIQVELGNLGKAVEAFGKARALKPGFYEAEMNYAAVNLQFRGFANAEEAYRAVLKSRPSDYDAHLGLALALRGQISESNFDAMVEAATKELHRAIEIDGARPEAYFNEGILTQEYKTRGTTEQNAKAFASARALFAAFIERARAKTTYAAAVKQAEERIGEIKEMEKFLGEGKAVPAGKPGGGDAPDAAPGEAGEAGDGAEPDPT